MTLEEQMMDEIRNGRQVDIERASLIVSGCDTEETVGIYRQKIQTLDNMFQEYAEARAVPSDMLSVGMALHGFLWRKRMSRAKKEMYKLTECVDAQFSWWKRKIGNCLGLTSLYACLGTRRGLDLNIRANENHILPVLNAYGNQIIVETTRRYGFLAKMDETESKFYGKLKQNKLLFIIASMLNSRGKAKMFIRNLNEAIEDFSHAMEIIHDYPAAYSNRGLAKIASGRYKEALTDFDMALDICPEDSGAYFGICLTKKKIGDQKGAEEALAKLQGLAEQLEQELKGDSQ